VVNTAVPARTATSAPAATAAPTKVPIGNKYLAPVGIDPSGDIYHDGNGISFHIASVGPLGSNECYRLDAQLLDQNGNVAGSDYWLLTGTCGNASGLNTRIPFGLPAHAPTGNNYAALARSAEAAAPGQQFTFRWWVTVVQNNGLGPDGVHYNTVALSPPSAPLDDVFVP
jgi:hypothetical protein